MSHCLYVGVTMSGKTTLARAISRALPRDSRVLVFDPLGTETAGGGWHPAAKIVENPDEFLDIVHSDEFVNADVFVDEAHHIFGHEFRDNFWLLTQGRHYGLRLHLMTQRPKKLHPDARTNCPRCYVFRLADQDMREIGADFGHSRISYEDLDRGDFLVLDSGSASYSRANVFQLLKGSPLCPPPSKKA